MAARTTWVRPSADLAYSGAPQGPGCL